MRWVLATVLGCSRGGFVSPDDLPMIRFLLLTTFATLWAYGFLFLTPLGGTSRERSATWFAARFEAAQRKGNHSFPGFAGRDGTLLISRVLL
jgi:hypothetical protein